MKGYYLFAPVEMENTGPESGVERKVRAQCEALNQYLDCTLVILPPVQYKGSTAEKIIRRLPLTAAWRKWKYKGEFNDAEFLYIRQVYHDASFVRWLRALRKQNPKVRLVYEVPTYPYLTEQKTSRANAAFRKKELLHFAWKDCRWDRPIAEECVRISIPVLGTNVASCFGYVVFASLVTGMGNTIFAAHSIAVTAETIFYIPGYGLRMATSTLVGISLGEGNRKKFEQVCRLSVALTIGMMILSGVVLYFAAYPLMCLFTPSEQAARIGSEMLRLVAFSEPFFGLMVVMEGIFYGLGRPKYAFYVETISMWGVRILLTYVCVRIWHLGLREVWYCMIVDNVCKAVLLAAPFLSGGYRKKLFPEKEVSEKK